MVVHVRKYSLGVWVIALCLLELTVATNSVLFTYLCMM